MKILFISLGCDKNLVDTEVMLGLLASRGYEMTDDERQADIIVINTCCFIHDAKEESIQNILEMAEYKKSGQVKALIVTCLLYTSRDDPSGCAYIVGTSGREAFGYKKSIFKNRSSYADV